MGDITISISDSSDFGCDINDEEISRYQERIEAALERAYPGCDVVWTSQHAPVKAMYVRGEDIGRDEELTRAVSDLLDAEWEEFCETEYDSAPAFLAAKSGRESADTDAAECRPGVVEVADLVWGNGGDGVVEALARDLGHTPNADEEQAAREGYEARVAELAKAAKAAYRLRDEGGTQDLAATTLEAAIEEARTLAEGGDYDDVTSTIWVDWSLLDRDGETVHEETTAIDPEAPKCVADHEHEWFSPQWLVGGLAENPGVWGHGGGVVIAEACKHCGCKKSTDTWAQNPDTGEQGLTSVRYERKVYVVAIEERAEQQAAEMSVGDDIDLDEMGALRRDTVERVLGERGLGVEAGKIIEQA